MTDRHERIARLRTLLTPEAMAERVRRAEERQAQLLLIDGLVREGRTRKAARDLLFPDEPLGALNRDFRYWREFGLDGLIDGRCPPTTNGVPRNARRVAIDLRRAMPTWTSDQIQRHMKKNSRIRVSARTVRLWLQEEGISLPPGWQRPMPQPEVPPPEPVVQTVTHAHPFAGAELLGAMDVLRKAPERMAAAISAHARGRPVPDQVEDDTAGRDRRGRFVGSYNAAKARRYPRLGAGFESVAHKRLRSHPWRRKIAQDKPAVIARKLRSLIMMPIAVHRGMRELDYGLFRGFGLLTGFAYRSSTLDKFTRELKFTEAGGVLAGEWGRLLGDAGEVVDPVTGLALVFGDATTHAIYTAHPTKSLLVSSRRKVMPGMSTTTLTNGVGSILQYSVASGTTSIRDALPALLARYEDAFGEGRANRVLVVDREGHARTFFEAIGTRWQFIIGLRSTVTGPNAEFRGRTAWVSRDEGGEVCEAELQLRGPRKADHMWIRVVGFRRHPEGNTMWFATNVPRERCEARHVISIYFQRWPCQELRFRDGKGRVGLHRQYGYGKSQPDRVALLQRTDELEGEIWSLGDLLWDAEADLRFLDAEQERGAAALAKLEVDRVAVTATLARAEDLPTDDLRAAGRSLADLQVAANFVREKLAKQTEDRQRCRRLAAGLASSLHSRHEEKERLAKRADEFTVDHDLDEVMLLPRVLFLHACGTLQREYLGTKFETDTLIRRILQLPGELHVTGTKRSVVIYRNVDDPVAMSAVERAIAVLTERQMDVEIRVGDRPAGGIR